MMKTKLFKLLLSTALLTPFTPSAVLADSDAGTANEKPDSIIDHESLPEHPVSFHGNTGTNWAVDSTGIMFIQAGPMLNPFFLLSREGRQMVKEVRVVPTDDCDKLILNSSSRNLFCHFSNLVKINTASFDTSNVQDMESMFAKCSSLENLDVSSFDTSNVRNMCSMFEGCSSLKSLDISGFDTSNVRNMSFMFCDCTSLESLNAAGFDTGGRGRCQTDYMFTDCSSLQKINLSKAFFNGNFMHKFPQEPSAIWVHSDDPGNEKPWEEIAQNWTDEDAGWWELSYSHLDFDTGGADELASVQTLTGNSIDLSEYLPSKPYHTFTGWYLDPECTEKADTTISLDSDKTIYAGWQIENRTLTFETNGGWEIKPVTTAYGSFMDLRYYIPVKPGWNFRGWYLDPECTVNAPDQHRLYSDETVYALWKQV